MKWQFERGPDYSGSRRSITDERAVSTTLGYALNLAVATLLVSGLLIAGGGFVKDQRERTAHSQLQVIGQQIAADVAAADRLANTGGTIDSVIVGRDLPETVTGAGYSIAVQSDATGAYLTLSTTSPDVSVRVNVTSETSVTETGISGGDVRVVYDPSTDELEVQNG